MEEEEGSTGGGRKWVSGSYGGECCAKVGRKNGIPGSYEVAWTATEKPLQKSRTEKKNYMCIYINYMYINKLYVYIYI